MINPMEWGVGIPRWFALHTLRKSLPLQCDMGVVSFSFDDVSQSACQSGAKVLEQNGCVGTWYAAGGLTDTHELGDACHTLEDLRRLKFLEGITLAAIPLLTSPARAGQLKT